MSVENKPEALLCWLCHSSAIGLKRRGNAGQDLHPDQFRITDSSYGVTADIYQCRDCGFLFCPTVENVLQQYQAMDDPEYESTRTERTLQARKLLERICHHQSGGSLLDIGAGSGIFVEEALKQGFTAVGIEPSEQLADIARQQGLPVLRGVLSQQSFEKHGFDLVTLVDVIEHVAQPAEFLREAVEQMKPDGLCLLVTPDVNSLCARLMGSRWWHYRIAHISYFNIKTLNRLLESAGLEIIEQKRPGWYFPASYLFNRCMSYLPEAIRLKPPAFLDGITVPLNLFDSLLLICRKKAPAHV
jgi:2-polyprenyl-3-methyl-5-hydroxy-6-metoxy-1,4-benzoquinol methylase